MWAWQFAKLQHAAVLNGWTTFSAMQDQYNVLKREEERDMIPMCLDQGVGLTPYSPLAKGRAARPWGEQTARSSSDAVAKAFDRDVDKPVVDAVQKVAEARGVPMAQVALAWVLSKPVVSCPIVGATKPNHLQDAVAALDLDLTDGRDRRAGGALHTAGQLLVVTPATVAGEVPSMTSPATARLGRHGHQAAVNVNCPEGTVKTV